MTAVTTSFVVGLSELGRGDLAVAGGKGANLGELLRAGFPVPDGFVVTTHAYALAAERAGLDDPSLAARLASGGQGPAALRAALEATAVPEEVAAAIGAASARLDGGPVAVRSSATAEDLPGAAFAGQQDTYLNVVGADEVLAAIRRCWASLWTDRAVSYRQRLGIGHDGVRIAVVVQEMVTADSAGVMFTANPVTGDRAQIVVDASPGLGEAVVAGLVTPDHYLLDEHGNVLQWSPGRREVVVRAVEGGGVAHERGAAQPTGSGRPERVLDAAQLTALATTGAAVARHFGRPQDLEWAFDARRLWLLQSRPMTALPPAPERLNRVQRLMGGALHEYLPQRPYPIDASSWLPEGPAGMMSRVAASIGFRGAFAGFIVEDHGVVERLSPRTPQPTLALLTAPLRLARRASRFDPRRWTEDGRFAAFLASNAELAALDLPDLAWGDLITVPRRAIDALEPLTELRIDYLPRSGLALARLALALKLLGEGGRLGGLLGGAPTRTADANRSLEGLARLVRDDPELSEAFAGAAASELTTLVAGHPEFRVAFDDFLREFGHRETTTPALLTPPTWADAPDTVLGLVKVLAAGDPAEAAPARSRAGAGDEALAQLLDLPEVARLGLRERLRRWVEAARAGVAFREDSHFYMTLPLPVLRRSVLEMGRRLVDAGVIDRPAEVFHLRLEELEAIADPQRLEDPEVDALRSKVADRAARRDELAGTPLVNLASLFPAPANGGEGLVKGAPASGGVASGPVRVIRGPDEFAKLRNGDVLVCPYTNPSWTPLFQRAAAVVVDSGSVASHAAIVAREYGIPAIVATRVGTTVLADDQAVTVDGNTGLVT